MNLRALSSHESTLVFRTMLSALAFPARRFELPPRLVAEMPAAVLPLLALVDIETSFHSQDHGAEIAVITSAPVVALPDARFVLFDRVPSRTDVCGLSRGTAHHPESGCGVFVAVDALPCAEAASRASADTPVTLSGPGIRAAITLAVPDDFLDFIAARSEVVVAAPAGIDCWFIAGDGGVMGLPRTTRVATSTAAAAESGR
jgi:alpha-D-ribose 1-methylphosphonate 5-triphosphate synthase subunit PhnH